MSSLISDRQKGYLYNKIEIDEVANMSDVISISLNDSDCLMQDNNISCITLDDSHDEDDNQQQAAGAEATQLEEGELNDEDCSDNNICEIKFASIFAFQKFGQLIADVLKEKLNEPEKKNAIDVVFTDSSSGTSLLVKHACDVVDKNNTFDLCSPNTDNSKSKTNNFDRELSPDLTGLSELFTIDPNPAEKLDSVKVPSYKRAIKEVLLDEEAAAHKRHKQEQKNLSAKTNSCFNCGESGHSIKECSEPHNSRRIKIAKKAFSKVERYHADVEQRFAHLKPGNISDKLREALGLRKGELPFFFYRMRTWGYPPGWLEESKVEQSGINLFNSDGSKVLHSDEEGDQSESSNPHKYNASKIIDFPGFNQDPGLGFYDDYKYHNVPPWSKNQSKAEFVKEMGHSILKVYKLKKLKDFPKANSDDTANDTVHSEVFDMEIEDADATTACNIEFVRPPPPNEPPESNTEIPPPPPEPETSACESTNTETIQLPGVSDVCSPTSPSLLELERKKKLLLQELESGSNNTSTVEIEDSLVDEILELDNSTKDTEKITAKTSAKTDKRNSNDTLGSLENSKELNKSSIVIEKSYMGTPVLQFSPYDCLPNGENFKVGVSDVINFENLPDSTGKYENMKEIIKKVRNVIHKLHSDD